MVWGFIGVLYRIYLKKILWIKKNLKIIIINDLFLSFINVKLLCVYLNFSRILVS